MGQTLYSKCSHDGITMCVCASGVCSLTPLSSNYFLIFGSIWLWTFLFKVTQAGFHSGGGGRVQAAEEDLPMRRGQGGHLKVLGYGEVWRKLAGREHILWG